MSDVAAILIKLKNNNEFLFNMDNTISRKYLKLFSQNLEIEF